MARRVPNGGTNGRRPNVAAAPLAESTRRDTRSRSLQRMVRRCPCSLRTLCKSPKKHSLRWALPKKGRQMAGSPGKHRSQKRQHESERRGSDYFRNAATTRSPIPIATKNNPTQRFGGEWAIQPVNAKNDPAKMKALGRVEVLLIGLFIKCRV